MAKNKFYHFLTSDSQFRIRLAIFIILLIVIGWQQHVIKVENKQLARVKVEKELISQTAQMQAALKGRYIKETVVKAPSIPFRLQGITRKNGVYYALIDGEVRMIGDNLQEYKIIKIIKDLVVLENQSNKAIKQLYLQN